MQDVAINLIKHFAGEHKVDANLALNIAKYESGYNQQAVSPQGAIGVMQLMPGTAKRFNVDPYNIVDNIRGGIMYLAALKEIYPERQDLQVASYNAGEHNVKKYGGIPPFKETQKFVTNVLGDNTPKHTKGDKAMNDPLQAAFTKQWPMTDPARQITATPIDSKASAQAVEALQASITPEQPKPIAPYGPQDVIPAEGRLAPISEKSSKWAQILGALAGIGGEPWGTVGKDLSVIAGKELELARANQAAQAVGSFTTPHLAAKNLEATGESTRASAAQSRAGALSTVVEALGKIRGLPGKTIMQTQLPGVLNPLPLPPGDVARAAQADESAQITKKHYDDWAKIGERNIKAVVDGKEVMLNAHEYIQSVQANQPQKAAKLSSSNEVMDKIIKMYDTHNAIAHRAGTPLQPFKPKSYFGEAELVGYAGLIRDTLADPYLAPKARFVMTLLGIKESELGGASVAAPAPAAPTRDVLPPPNPFAGF